MRKAALLIGIILPLLDARAQESTPALPAAKQLRIVIPSVPGAGPDFIARLLAPTLGEALRQAVIVENRASANGVVAAQFTARTPPDGSVIMLGNAGTHAVNAALYRKLDYDPIADFAPIGELASAPLVLAVHPSVPARSVQELVALARRSPGKLNVAIAGAAGELMTNALKLQAAVSMSNIPYKGGGAAVVAVMGGEADMVFTSYVAIAAHVASARLRVLGVSSAQRMPQLPEVPTVAEGGLPGYEHEQWYAFFAAARTPPPLVDALNRATVRSLQTLEIQERLLATGHRIVAGTPQELAQKVRREIDKTRQIVAASGMQQH